MTADVSDNYYVCSRCQMPVVLVAGRWQHAEAADAAFCQLVMTRQAVPDADQE